MQRQHNLIVIAGQRIIRGRHQDGLAAKRQQRHGSRRIVIAWRTLRGEHGQLSAIGRQYIHHRKQLLAILLT
jgi:hypothetical protein